MCGKSAPSRRNGSKATAYGGGRLLALICDEFVTFDGVVVEVHRIEPNGIFTVDREARFEPEALLTPGEYILAQ
jgi:hypothetical protein